MNWNIVDENWQQFKRRLKALWGKLVGVNGNPSAARSLLTLTEYGLRMNSAAAQKWLLGLPYALRH